MKITIVSIFFLFNVALCFVSPSVSADNPIIPGVGLSDPHVRIFNNKIYLYSGHDDSPTDPLWVMKDWRVFSSDDLINWKLETTIYPKDNYLADDSVDAWAGDAATRHGKFYFYFSDRDRSAGVMESDSPSGPFVDKRGTPLVDKHDPTVFIDDDKNKTPYIIYGDKHGNLDYQIAQLNDDMSSLAEKPKKIIINGSEWDNAPIWQDKNYLFKRNGIYYLSWGRDYAVSKNIYGPYETLGAVGNGHNLNGYAHGSFFKWKGQFYHIWCYYINGHRLKFRDTIISYTHFTDDGKIVTDTEFLDKHFSNGVGQYDANWPEIEAEWFYEKSTDIIKKEKKDDGFLLDNIGNNSYVIFPNIKNLVVAKTLTFNLQPNRSVSKNKETKIEIRDSSPTGKLLTTCYLPAEVSKAFIDVSCELPPLSSKASLALVFKGDGNNLFKFNKMEFSPSKQ